MSSSVRGSPGGHLLGMSAAHQSAESGQGQPHKQDGQGKNKPGVRGVNDGDNLQIEPLRGCCCASLPRALTCGLKADLSALEATRPLTFFPFTYESKLFNQSFTPPIFFNRRRAPHHSYARSPSAVRKSAIRQIYLLLRRQMSFSSARGSVHGSAETSQQATHVSAHRRNMTH